MNPIQSIIASAALVALTIPAAPAQSTGTGSTAPATTTTSPTKPATATQPTAKLTSEFSALAGSTDNAQSLIQGLRTGSAITLTTPPPPGSTTIPPTSTTFTPPTKPMGYGNIKIALSLARTELAGQGITNPTPEQLQGALMGTQATPTQSGTQGILQMRASGMGWGQIANSMGVKLGAVMSGKQVMPATASGATTAAGTATSAGKSSASESRVTTAGGGSGAGNTAASAKGKGVVTAAGSNAGGNAAGATGHGQGASASGGVVSAAGGQGAGASNAAHGKSGKN